MVDRTETPTGVRGRDDFYLSTHPDLVAAVNELDSNIDEDWALEHVPQIRAMQELVIDASNVSRGASVLVRIMSEFAVDGEEFQPSVDENLRKWLVTTVRTEVPELDDATVEMLVDSVQDYPPVDKERAQELATSTGSS